MKPFVFAWILMMSPFLAGVAAPTVAAPLSTEQEGERITLSGSVGSLTDRGFMLDYGKESITVQMDGFRSHKYGSIKPGQRVTVSGKVDSDFFDSRQIEASSVHVAGSGAYYYADPRDEEGGFYSYPLNELGGDWVSFIGKVTAIDAPQFVIDIAGRKVRVSTEGLPYNPLDGRGLERQIHVGDRVSVYGSMTDSDLFAKGTLDAISVVVLESGRGAVEQSIGTSSPSGQ